MPDLNKLIYRQLYKKSFYDFLKDFWQCADPSKLVDGVLVQFYCECFQYFCKDWIPYTPIDVKIPDEYKDYDVLDVRQNKRNLCLNVPPSHSKSMAFNVMGPVWLWLNEPVKAASISHTFDLAKDMNSKRQLLINSEKFRYYFGDEFRLVSNTVDTLKDDRGGELYSQNRDSMTGFHADIIINDDLTNAEAARKDKQEMNNAWNYYRNTMPSRINNVNKCLIMNIQQRLAPNDITGHIMNDPKLRESYCFVVLPAIFDKNTILVCPISGDLAVFKAGDPLWPERFGDYSSVRFQVGEGVFQTQYLQKPVASDRTVIKEDMIVRKNQPDVPSIDQADMIYSSHDFPVKDKESSDFLGSVLAYRVGSTLYIKDCLEKRMAFVASVEYVKALDQHYPGIMQVIEDKANGTPVIQQLQDEVQGIVPFQPGTQSKTQRMESASLYMNIGNVVFVRDRFDSLSQTWNLSDGLDNLIRRLLNFPFVEHDDICDAFSQLVLFVFMDRRYMVYGRSFDDFNVIDYVPSEDRKEYSTVFFNREGDTWKIAEIVVSYGEQTKIIVKREWLFRGKIDTALDSMKKFSPGQNVFIDCSQGESLYGIDMKGLTIEKYAIDDFGKSVTALNMAFGNKTVAIDRSCRMTKSDIENFKYEKTKDETASFRTEKDGFVSCIRTAMKYYGVGD
jgi:hypothetical protein